MRPRSALRRLSLFSWLACAPLSAAPAAPHGDSSFPAHFESVELNGTLIRSCDLVFLAGGDMLIASKRGFVYYHNGTGLQSTFVLDLDHEITSTGDRGLLGLAAHPGWVPDGGATSWIYLVYTVSPVPGEDPVYNDNDKFAFGRLTRYRTDTVGGDVVALPGTRQVLLGNQLPDGSVPDAIATLFHSHNVGSLFFGEDGTLLMSTGEGAHANQADTGGVDAGGFQDFTHPKTGLKGPMAVEQDSGVFRAQDMRSLAGKILRLDPATGLGLPSNPFYDGDPSSIASRVWALGLRNPYRAHLVPGTGSSDPALGDPGDILLGDVGWADREELDLCSGGENFQWPCFEGSAPHPLYSEHDFGANPLGFPDCANPGPGVMTPPLVSWSHGSPGGLVPSGVHVDEFGAPQAGFIGGAAIGPARYTGTEYPPEYFGRYFFADYAGDWIRTLTLDGANQVVEIADFGFDTDLVVDIEAHPITGDIHYVTLGAVNLDGHVHRIRYGSNLTPVAALSATPTFGEAPLTVDFDAGDTVDPEGDPLQWSWDFGDGSPAASGETVQHTFLTEGLFTVTLTATDDGGLSDDAELLIAVGDVPPLARITSPVQGSTFVDFQTLLLDGIGTDFQGGELTYEWNVDLQHNTHFHPNEFQASGQSAAFLVEPHGDPDELFYLRIQLTARSANGLEGTDHVFVYPTTNLVDPTGTGQVITRMQELVPPHPTGTGNQDPEVMRDGDLPPAGSTQRDRQFDTFHGGDQGSDDWVGIELTDEVLPESLRFTGLVFQEGVHFNAGGWFEDFWVEVRDDDVWEVVENLHVIPDYPFELSAQPGFDGLSYETYELRFDPTHGDAVRLRGIPGGSSGFISVGELRAHLVRPIAPDVWNDLTSEGTIITKLAELTPPAPQGGGNKNPEIIRNGTFPPQGSASLFGQVDTFHFGDQGPEDWFGYSFADWHTFERVLFQEGFHYASPVEGGWFQDLGVQVRADDGAAWTPVTGLSVTPSAPGDTSAAGTYETYELLFDPVVARQVRLIGTPGGAHGFISLAELRVYEPAIDASQCGWQTYGAGLGGTNVLALGASTPGLLGLPNMVESSGAPGAGPGLVIASPNAVSAPILGGTLLVNPVGATLIPTTFAADGTSLLPLTLPADPSLVGASFYLQMLGTDPGQPGVLLFSNGLEIVFCE